MLMLILTEQQAAALRGPTGQGAALNPVILADGATWVLPARVLDDPAHAAVHAVLAVLPQRAVDPSEFPQASEE